MSTACMSKAPSISSRMAGVQGSAPKMPTRSGEAAGVEPLRAVLVEDRKHVGGRHHDRRGAEILDQPHLPRGHPARGRHHRAAEPLRAVMRAEPSGEEPVAVADVNHVPGPRPRGAHRAGHDLGPGGEVPLGVAHHRRLPSGPAARMDAPNPLARDGEHAEGVGRAQIRLGGEGEPREVRQLRQVVRMHARRLEGPPGGLDVLPKRAAATTEAARAAAPRSRRARPARSDRAPPAEGPGPSRGHPAERLRRVPAARGPGPREALAVGGPGGGGASPRLSPSREVPQPHAASSSIATP